MDAAKLSRLLLDNALHLDSCIVPSPDDEAIGRQAVENGEWPEEKRDHDLDIVGQVVRIERSRTQLEADVHAYQRENGVSALCRDRFVFPLGTGRTVAIVEVGWGLELQPGDGERLVRCSQQQAEAFLAFASGEAAAAGWTLWREIYDEEDEKSSFYPATESDVRGEIQTATSGYLVTSPWPLAVIQTPGEALMLHLHQGAFPGDTGEIWGDATTACFVLVAPGQVGRLLVEATA